MISLKNRDHKNVMDGIVRLKNRDLQVMLTRGKGMFYNVNNWKPSEMKIKIYLYLQCDF